jgi:hypothetical protein
MLPSDASTATQTQQQQQQQQVLRTLNPTVPSMFQVDWIFTGQIQTPVTSLCLRQVQQCRHLQQWKQRLQPRRMRALTKILLRKQQQLQLMHQISALLLQMLQGLLQIWSQHQHQPQQQEQMMQENMHQGLLWTQD